MKYKFEHIATNSTAKKLPEESDRKHYIGLEHLDTNCFTISRWGSDVTPVGEKLLMKKGDVLFGKRRAYQRKVGIAPFDGIFSAHGMVLRPKEDVIDKDFFPFFINSDQFMERAIRISVGGLSPTINWKDLKEQVFELPSLEEQKVLASKLWAAYNLKESYKTLLAKTDELVKSRFIEMFGDPVNNSKGWPVLTMKESSELLSDGPFGSNLKSEHYTEKGIRVIRLQNICQGYFEDTDKAFVSEEHYRLLEKYTCKPGDIVIGTLGEPNLRACVIPLTVPISINKADCVHYIPRSSLLNTTFACAYINNPGLLHIASSSLHGTTRSRIAARQVSQLPIFIPPIRLQLEYERFAKQADKSKFELKQAIEKIDKVMRALLQ